MILLSIGTHKNHHPINREYPMKRSCGIFVLFLSIWTGLAGHVLAQSDPGLLKGFERRRQKLKEQMEGGIAVMRNSALALRNNDEYYEYEANCDFYYMTGMDAPEAAMILAPGQEKAYILFVEPKNAITRQWFGELPGIEGAMDIFGADTAYPKREFENVLREMLRQADRVYFDTRNEELYETIHDLLPYRRIPKHSMVDLIPMIHEMRVIKDKDEIEQIRKAVEISCEGHLQTMKAAEPGMVEYQLEAVFNYICEKNGSPRMAYPSIVGSGPTASIFHYSANTRKILNGDMVVLDMGCEYGYYASDITRSYPVNGKFTSRQREVYEIVLEGEQAAIDWMEPGHKWYECFRRAENVIREGLFRLGLITDKDTKWQHFLYYYPYMGHPVGLDVHDVGDYGSLRDGGRVLEPGMVFAVEPMIYVGENLIDSFKQLATMHWGASKEEVEAFFREIMPVFEQYKEICCRVEDNVLITEDGYVNLSRHLPRTVKEIEKAMAGKAEL
jgi:Xaa-Pro aminopeptidase